jgi:CRISPR-associated endonuclease Csn1
MNTLNIYAGIRSIGWNVTEYGEVKNFGVKRVNVDFDSYYAFIAGNPVEKRIIRRQKRQARRNLWRFKARREKLVKLLREDGLMPQNDAEYSRKELNQLRAIACAVKLDNRENVGRVLLDLQLKRGYKSMRGVDDTGDSDYLKTIEQHENALRFFPSVGDYLLTLPTFKNVILRRETYENEFRKICEVQGLDYEHYYGAIYYQRPLKKGKIAFCRLEPNRKVTHASNPAYQRLRIFKEVNNIEIYYLENNAIDISEEHRKEFLGELFRGKDLTKAGCLKIMGIKKPANYKWYCGKSIAGNIWGKILTKKDDDGFVPYDYAYQVWQDLISATDNEKLTAILQRKYPDENYQNLIDFDIQATGWSDYSEKAIKKLLPEMRIGKTLNEAILSIYRKVNMSTGVALRNIVLEQVFASAKSLVSAIKEKYNIYELQLEIDPLLKMGNKARKARATATRRAEKDNAELDRRISEVGANANEYNRKKLRLWDETGGVCPYFPDEKIELSELFTNAYNLDHIVPKSKLFNFSEENLVICPTKLNTKKLRQTGRDFVREIGRNEEKYVEFVNSSKISERKKTLLLMRDEDIPTDFVSRNAGTDYNTRCFLTLHGNSRCIPNKLISMYGKNWYGNQYNENDVREVLVKSFVMANMNEKTVEYFDRIKENTKSQTSSGAYDLQPEIELPDLSNTAVFCPKTKFFRRTKFGYISRFGLHKETVYGQRNRVYRNAKGEEKTEHFYTVRHAISSLTPKMILNISDMHIRKLVHERYEKEGKNFAISIEENPIIFNGKPVKSVSVNVGGSMLVPLHSADGGHTSKFSKHERKVDFVYNSINYSLAIEKGKRKVLPLLQAVRNLNEKVFESKGYHKGDRVVYEGKQYIISGLDDSGIALRSVYTLLAENALKLTKPTEIEKLVKQHISQVNNPL